MTTVKEVLKLPELQDAKLRAGDPGLHREIRWVHSIDHEDVGHYLEGGEFLLSCGQVWPSTQESECQLLESFLQHQIAGIVFATGGYITEIPLAVLSFAQKHEIPVFEVPFQVSFVKVTQSILQKLLQTGENTASSRGQVLDDVVGQFRDAHSASDICHVLSINLGSYVVITNAEGQILTEAMVSGIKQTYIKETIETFNHVLNSRDKYESPLQDAASNQPIFIPTKQPPYALCVPLKVNQEDRFVLWLLNDRRPLEKDDGQVAEHAAVALTYFILNEQEAEAARRRRRLELLQLLLEDSPQGSLAIEEKMQELGLATRSYWLAGLVLSGQDGKNEDMLLWRGLCQRWIDETPEISGFCEVYREQLLLAVSRPFHSVDFETHLAALYEFLRGTQGVPILVFGSVKASIHVLEESYQDTQILTPIVQYRSAVGGVYFTDAFKREMFVYSSFSPQRAREFRNLILPQALFSEKGAPLYETLKSLAHHEYSRDQVAKALHIHRNTLRYRIRRIEHLMGDNLSSSRCQFWVQMALDLESIAKQC